MRDATPFDLSVPGHFGAAPGGVVIAPITIAAAWNVQAPRDVEPFLSVARSLFGVELPLLANATSHDDAITALWIGPRSWLLVAGGHSPLDDFKAKRDAINAAGGALFDVSTSRVAWSVSGPRAADVLASGCPLDLHPRAFVTGACAQSAFGHVNVLIEKHDDTPTFVLMAARSFGRDVEHALAIVAAQYGCGVRAAHPYG